MEEKRLAFEIVNGRSGEAESEGVNGRKEAESMRVKDERCQEVRG